MPSGQYFDSYVEELHKGSHNWASNAFKLMLSAVAPVNGNTVKANLTEIAAGNGYTAGGAALTPTMTRVGKLQKVNFANVTFTGSGAGMAGFRYYAIYNDTSASDLLVAWYDFGSTVTLAAAQAHTINFNSTLGALGADFT